MRNDFDLSLAEKFLHISTKGAEHPLFSVVGTELLKPDVMDDLLERSRALLKGTGAEIAVSFVGLAFFGIPTAVHAYMCLYDHVLDLSLDNVTVELESHDDHAHLRFRINALRWKPLPAEHREEAFAQQLELLFRSSITPVVEAIAAARGFKPDMIWNQFGARMISVRDYIMQQLPNEAARAKYAAGYELLLHGLAGDVFHRRKNPYIHTPKYVDSPYRPGEKALIRSACCMWYKREDGVKCYTCPMLTPAQRHERKLEIEARQAASG